MIVFSLTVGDRHTDEYIIQRCENILKFVPNSFIVINLQTYRPLAINNYDKIYIHSKRRGNALGAHIDNFKAAQNILHFDYFVFESMESLIVRYGLDDYINEYDAGFNIYNKEAVNIDYFQWYQFNQFRNTGNSMYQYILKSGIKYLYKTQIEGSWVSHSILSEIIEILETDTPDYFEQGMLWKTMGSENSEYWTEEIYLPTLILNLYKNIRIGEPYVYINLYDWANGFRISLDRIISIVKENMPTTKIPNTDIVKQSSHTFAVRKIPEDNRNPCRYYILNNI